MYQDKVAATVRVRYPSALFASIFISSGVLIIIIVTDRKGLRCFIRVR